jgi:hypothetical protein
MFLFLKVVISNNKRSGITSLSGGKLSFNLKELAFNSPWNNRYYQNFTTHTRSAELW